ncbi:hypothetical protein N7470_002886 [Penicillium chermesinum]|nr:hypothetical protein N7470_002886 [Penicillium chermesinum]
MTLTWKDNDQARAASESFYSLALRHLQAIPTHSEIQALQISLLLAHYGHMCPERVDNWTCISNAIRIVLNLGLHLESPQGLSEETIRERTNLFWVAYGMERSLCTNLRLPLSFPEESIAVKLDPIVKDPFQQNVDIDRLLPQSASSHICHYRALETEVHRVLHLEEDLQKFGCDTIENWTTDISSRLGEWYETAKLYTPYNMLEFKAVQFHHLIARIHRPTPRLRTRSAEDRQMVLNASLVLIDDYLSQERRRRLFYPWHGVHILFETAIIALEACWSSRHWDQAKLQAMSVLEVSLPQCLDLLRQIGQRWNEASLCADRLEPLIKQVHSVLATTGYVFDELEAPITKEIDGLLFPDAPLIWNRDASQDFTVGVADGTDFLNSFLEDGLEFFQWDPEWDIMSSETL